MPARRLILPLLWLGALLLGPAIRSASAQTRPLARPDSLVREPADSLVIEPVVVPDTLVPAAGAPPGVYEPLAPARRRAPEQGPASFAYVDSLTSRLLLLGRWTAADSLGRLALAAGTDYPVLRQRLGYAATLRGRPAEAVRQYQHALHDNAADPVSRLGLSYAWLALNQRELASRAARPLSDSVRRALHLTPRALARLEAEGSVQWPTSRGRGTAGFGRLEAVSQLGGGLLLTQTVAYYGQQVRYGFPPDGPPPPGPLPPGPPRPSLVPVRQHDYQALLTAPLGGRLLGKLAYHFVRSRFADNYYQGHLGYAALRYVRPTWQLQAGLYAGRLTDTTRTQTDVQLSVFPLGNLHLHAFGRAALVRTAGRSYPHLVLGAGGRLAPRLWLDGYAGWGRVPVLADQDGTYVYNLLDPLRRRLGLGLLVPLPGGNWLGRLYYGAEARTQIQTLTPYTQHTLTLAATWTW